MISMATFWPTTSSWVNPKIRSAAEFIDSTVPCSSMVMMPSTAVSTMALSRTAASRTASSAFLRSVMSRAILVNPRRRFSSSKMGVRHAAGEEPAAVLALVPPLIARAALGGGRRDLPLGDSAVLIVLGE